MVTHPPHPSEGSPAGQAAEASERIAKALARAGVASRREVERLIEAGRIAVNGETLMTPAIKVSSTDLVTLDGAAVQAAEPARLFRYHKPAGLVTTHRDPGGRPTVFAALPAGLPRLISIGRLDLMSEGLLLLTNDGALARGLELPSSGYRRRYRARARGRIDQARLDTLADGIEIDGVRYGPIEARLDKARGDSAAANLWISVTLAEGKNREVRRVLEALGLTVNRLLRLAYGPFALGELAPGAVEEVGPRVVREQLAHLVPADRLPSGDQPLWRPPAAAPVARSRRDPSPQSAPAKRKTYKPGWARPKIAAPLTSAAAPRPRRRPDGAAGRGARPPR